MLRRHVAGHLFEIRGVLFLRHPFDACKKDSTTASSLSLVRFDDNDYSVPVRYAHHPVVVKGYTDRVEIFYQDELIARHDRSWKKEGVEAVIVAESA